MGVALPRFRPGVSGASGTIRRVQNAADSAGISEERIISDVLIRFPGGAHRVPAVSVPAEGATREVYTYGETVTLHLEDGSTVPVPTHEFKRKDA